MLRDLSIKKKLTLGFAPFLALLQASAPHDGCADWAVKT